MFVDDPPVGPVAPAHAFDEAKLQAYLLARLEDFSPPMRVQQFRGGASNPTFLLTAGDGANAKRFVLRKKPPGVLLASAHQVEREYRVASALQSVGFPTAPMRLLCEEPEIVGTNFYVMDYLPGRIFRDATLPDLQPAERAAIYDDLNARLAQLHQVDWRGIGLEGFGKAGAYFERQVARWIKQYRGAESEPIAAMEALIEELPARIPKDDSVAIAHGDYRLENVMFHPTEPRIIAVLDWELCTIGHPLADLGYVAGLWRSHDPGWGSLDGVEFGASGIPTEQAFVEAYCRRTGRDAIEDWRFYVAFGQFRLAAIAQGVYRRVLSGAVASDRPAINGTPDRAQLALDILHGRA
ncbi:MAG: phosphotransferase [Alphaproteobacteria bacterium]|nr:phosphotransferase [Alphaproteobacteria bacterium]